MKPHVKRFLEEEETRAARSKKAKRRKQKRIDEKFVQRIILSVEKVEANGNPAGAEQIRKSLRKFFPAYAKLFPETPATNKQRKAR